MYGHSNSYETTDEKKTYERIYKDVACSSKCYGICKVPSLCEVIGR
jgi:hypothetical protein